MKTPRELLLARHRAVEPRLDALRRRVVAEHVGLDTDEAEIPAGSGFYARLWQELFWSNRRAWAGLAAVWLVIVPLHFAMQEPSPSQALAAQRTVLTPLAHAALAEQHRLKAELLGTLPPLAAPAERDPAPPRTEFRSRLTA